MDLSEMIERVIRRTKRADKRDEIIDAINNAISFFSLGASFGQDLVEGTVNIVATDYAQSLSISANFTRFRRIKYLKRTGARFPLKQVDPLKVFDALGCEQLDRWYRAGNNIVFKLQTLSATLEYGFYQYPELLEDDEDTHWMLDIVPMMIFNKACAEIFQSIGDADRDYQLCEGRAMQAFEVAKQDFEDGGTATSS